MNKKTSKHLKEVKKQLYQNLFASYRGWWQWFLIKKTKGYGDRTAVLLLPGSNRDINYMALLYLDHMLKDRHYQNVIILAHDLAVQKAAPLFSKNILHMIPFSRKKAEDLMQFYCLYEFNKRFVIASLDEPNGRNGLALLGKRGTTLEELFVIGIYRLYPFERPAEPIYDGSDPDIMTFLGRYSGKDGMK